MSTRYTNDHEWARQEGDVVVVGITDFAQQQLGEVVFVELPDIDQELQQGEESAVVESVKAAGEVKAPVDGVVVEVNEELVDNPENVNDSPSGGGWFYKMKPSDPDQLTALLDEDGYQSYLESLT